MLSYLNGRLDEVNEIVWALDQIDFMQGMKEGMSCRIKHHGG